MKLKNLILLLIIFASSTLNAQIPAITTKSMQYKESKNSKIFTLIPSKYVKFTIKVGANTTILSNTNSIDDMNDLENIEINSFINYDLRLKLYIMKKIRILLKTKTSTENSYTNTIGIIYIL